MIEVPYQQGRPVPSRTGERIRVRIIHQLDPDALIPGGIPTFIRGLLDAAPTDIQFSIVGLTTDDCARPVGRWTTLERSGREIPFFPVARDRHPGSRSRVPLSVKMVAGVFRYLGTCRGDCDILEFHRFETMLPFVRDDRPKNAFVHQNMKDLRNAKSDIKWRYMPDAYFALERRLIPKCASVFCVRADAVSEYRTAFPRIAERFRFTPTWMDPTRFHPVSRTRRDELRRAFQGALGLFPEAEILVSVGRLDQQKDPLLMVDAFARIKAVRRNTQLIMLGDGPLRRAIEARVNVLGLSGGVIFAGLRAADEVAQLLQASDAFLLTSAYEGMPMSVLEALGCGVPVVTTNVGEVRRVVHSGRNGEVVDDHSPEAFANATLELLSRGEACRGTCCVEAVAGFVPDTVLAPIYRNYRDLASRSAS